MGVVRDGPALLAGVIAHCYGFSRQGLCSSQLCRIVAPGLPAGTILLVPPRVAARPWEMTRQVEMLLGGFAQAEGAAMRRGAHELVLRRQRELARHGRESGCRVGDWRESRPTIHQDADSKS